MIINQGIGGEISTELVKHIAPLILRIVVGSFVAMIVGPWLGGKKIVGLRVDAHKVFQGWLAENGKRDVFNKMWKTHGDEMPCPDFYDCFLGEGGWPTFRIYLEDTVFNRYDSSDTSMMRLAEFLEEADGSYKATRWWPKSLLRVARSVGGSLDNLRHSLAPVPFGI